MKCTQCSQPVKPVVAVDLDGTLLDYHRHFLNFLETYIMGHPPIHPRSYLYDGSIKFRDWGQKEFGIDERTWHDIKLAYRQGAQKRSAPIYPGAVDLCQMVQRRGGELWITTTRPYMRLDNVDPDTRAWLKRHGILYDGMLYDKTKYKRLPEVVDRSRVVAILEDLPYQIEMAKEEFGNDIPIYRRTEFNSGVEVPGVTDTSNLQYAEELIAVRIDDWYENHG